MIIDVARREAVAAFYARHAERVRRQVGRRVNADHCVIEDACQQAWATLLRRPDIELDERGAAWLVTVAIHAGWHDTAEREIPMGSFRGLVARSGELAEPPSLEPACDDQAMARIEHEERLRFVRRLRAPERKVLWLFAMGCSYREIARATGSGMSAVNHRMNRGRTRLRVTLKA